MYACAIELQGMYSPSNFDFVSSLFSMGIEGFDNYMNGMSYCVNICSSYIFSVRFFNYILITYSVCDCK